MAYHPARLAGLGEAYLLAGRARDALDQAVRALELSRQQGEQGSEAWVLRLLGGIHAHEESRDVANAEDYYRRALTLAAELGMRPLVAHCHLGLGKLHRRTDKQDRAREHLLTATTMYREMDMPFWLEKVEAEMRELV